MYNEYAMFLKERRGKSTPEEKLEDSETAVGVKNQESHSGIRAVEAMDRGRGCSPS